MFLGSGISVCWKLLALKGFQFPRLLELLWCDSEGVQHWRLHVLPTVPKELPDLSNGLQPKEPNGDGLQHPPTYILAPSTFRMPGAGQCCRGCSNRLSLLFVEVMLERLYRSHDFAFETAVGHATRTVASELSGHQFNG